MKKLAAAGMTLTLVLSHFAGVTGWAQTTADTSVLTASASPAADASLAAATSSAAPEPQSLAAPENVKLEVKRNQIVLTWDAVPGATSYRVEADGKEQNAGKQTTYTDIASVRDVHRYRVRAYRDAVPGEWSQEIYQTPYAAPQTARAILVSDTVTQQAAMDGQELWFKINPDRSGRLSVMLSEPRGGVTASLALCDKEGTEAVFSQQEDGTTGIANVDIGKGVHYIKATVGNAGDGKQSITFKTTYQATQSETLPKAVTDQARKLTGAKPSAGLTFGSFPIDEGAVTDEFSVKTLLRWYPIEIGDTPQSAPFVLSGDDTLLNNSAMVLYSKAGTLIAAGQDIRPVMDKNTTYYLGVYTRSFEEIAENPAYQISIRGTERDIRFQGVGGGRYIYCNNHEAIRKENVINLTNREITNRSFLMSLTDLKPGKYVIFASHNNDTDYDSYGNQTKSNPGFDLFLDAIIQRRGGANVTVERCGYWTKDEPNESWVAMKAWADYYGVNIRELPYQPEELNGKTTAIRTGGQYYAQPYRPRPLAFDAQNQAWLTTALDQAPLPCAPNQPVFFIAAFTVTGEEGAAIDLNIGALRSVEGSIDRSRSVAPDVQPGKLVPDYQMKGIAETLPVLQTALTYTVDNATQALPVRLYNEKKPFGIDLTDGFITHGVPRADGFGYGWMYAQNDILPFTYTDPDGKTHKFDAKTPWSSGVGQTTYNLGNFGVVTRYHLSITNHADADRQFVYRMTTASNYMVRLSADSLVSAANPNGYCRSEGYDMLSRNEIHYPSGGMQKAPAELVRCPLPQGKTTNIVLEVFSPTNVTGSLENQFLIEPLEPSEEEMQ